MKKNCDNCRHVLKSAEEYPCNGCFGNACFEPAVDVVNHLNCDRKDIRLNGKKVIVFVK